MPKSKVVQGDTGAEGEQQSLLEDLGQKPDDSVIYITCRVLRRKYGYLQVKAWTEKEFDEVVLREDFNIYDA